MLLQYLVVKFENVHILRDLVTVIFFCLFIFYHLVNIVGMAAFNKHVIFIHVLMSVVNL